MFSDDDLILKIADRSDWENVEAFDPDFVDVANELLELRRRVVLIRRALDEPVWPLVEGQR